VTAISVDPLIAEARRRARRRRLAYVVAVVVAGGIVAALVPRGGDGGSSVDERRALVRAAARTTISDAGLVGRDGVWAMNGIGLWYSTDGGSAWRAVTPPVPGDVSGHVVQVQFADAAHGWVSAATNPDGRLLFRTADGGRTWVAARGCAPCGGTLSFLDPRTGFSLALGSLFRTGDGGVTWRRVARVPFQGWIEFTDTRHGWGVAWERPALYRTDDGGRTWTRVLRGYATLPEHGVVAVPGFVVAGSGVRRALPVRVGGRAPVFTASSRTDFVFWARGTLWRSSDAGRSWQRIDSKVPPRSVWNLRFTSPDDGWAIFGVVTGTGYLRGAALARTTNGGRDWSAVTPPVPRVRYVAPTPQCGSACRRP
jgi:photosystem II stability/assembly factor-like uncharacterized protein